MAPDPGAYTVACSLKKAIPDNGHLEKIQDGVRRVHRCTFYATELLNLYIRDRIENHNGEGLESIFTQNWLLNAYYTVSNSTGTRLPTIDSGVKEIFDQYMSGTFTPEDRTGLTQALRYECINLAAVGSTNVWMHFQKRVLSFVRSCFAMDEAHYSRLSKEQRSQRKLDLMKVAEDLCRDPTLTMRSPESYHEWIHEQRVQLGISTAVVDWDDKPLLYHLKAKPHRFVVAMYKMSTEQCAMGRKAFALFPLRRSHVPGHMRFDSSVLDDLLCLGCANAARAVKKKAKEKECVNLNVQSTGPFGRAPKRKRGDPSLIEEKAEVFNKVLDLRAARVHRRAHFAFAFTTDGVSLHLNMTKSKKLMEPSTEKKPKLKSRTQAGRAHVFMPKRGIHCIDALKAATRAEDVHTIGIDPGKRELIVAVDQDNPKDSPVVRYTLAQRQKDMRTRQYIDESRRFKPHTVVVEEETLSKFNSKSPSLKEFARFAAERRRSMRDTPEAQAFYDEMHHRDRRRKTRIKVQKSEANLVKRIASMHAKDDKRTLVLAYGAWGLVAGRPNMAANKGTPPAIGAGLMKKLALHFVVAPTPEHFTSKTCVRCMGPCGPHPTLKTKNGKEIRGLRVCQHEGCGLLQNRDKTGATNIGLQFNRLLQGKSPIRTMDDTELEFHRLNVCLECDDL